MNLEYMFKILKKLGSGTFGITYLVEDLEGNQLALKAIDVAKSTANGSDVDDIMDEIDTLAKLSAEPRCFPYIVCYFGYYRGDLAGRDTLAILSEYINGPTLEQYISDHKQTIPPDQLLLYMYQMLTGLAHVHQLGYAHRDIKPGNIIFDTVHNAMKLIDFGLACTQKCKGFAGTLFWIPPELFEKPLPDSLDAAQAHDIWSLGLVFYELVNHRLPFNVTGKETQEDIKRLVNGDFIPSHYNSGLLVDDKINHMIDQMLHKEWEMRPTALEVMDYIESIAKRQDRYFVSSPHIAG